ncbi:EamA family transporter [Inconstantimicrobium mannanitabidum]|uniref:Membrane protein n=1 Tax=Inconstantimicrobium mannanitabidum TaxID=1604901 RepID=A0ACB5RG91_9CLOT|nr:EamA family transporter [Clostridium sp. TW13]GKX68077.1 membrane protein [Clostridium sp. TW13]
MDKFIQSIKNNKIGIMLIVLASLMTSVGQLFWKLSSSNKIIFLFLGFVLYGIGAIVMILAFKHGSLSVIHPMLSFGYVFALVLGTIVLKEKISTFQYVGILLIIIGVVLIGGGDE